MRPSNSDDFFIGWESRPTENRRKLRILLGVSIIALVIGFTQSIRQQTLEVASFEFGTVKGFQGTIVMDPVPSLAVQRPGLHGPFSPHSRYILVSPNKFGANTEDIRGFEGKQVLLDGTLIYRDTQVMIEVDPGSIFEFDSLLPEIPLESPEIVGEATLFGEIVDSKCYLGAMNPGNLKAHRACAIRCISGGIPPLLVSRLPDGGRLTFVLESKNERIINSQILHLVAEPVIISGLIRRYGDQFSILVDPQSIRHQ